MKRYSIWLSAGLIIISFLLGCSSGNEEDETQTYTGISGHTYTNKEYEFQISLPKDLAEWSITDETGGIGLVVMKDSLGTSVNVVVEILQVSLTSQGYWEASLQFLKTIVEDYKEESRHTLKIDGKDGLEVIYTGKMMNMKLKWIQQIVVKGQYGYVITGTAGAENFQVDTFRRIMSTFKFLP